MNMRIGALSPSGSGGHAGWQGPMLAAAGGAGLIASLWLPWYTATATLSAWQTFTAMPTVLAVIGALVALLSVLELSQRTGDTSRLALLGGALAAVLVGYRLAVPPLAALHSASGTYFALVSAVTVMAGGFLAADQELPELPLISLAQTPAPRVPSPPAP
jgi:hypothetical protein